MPLYLFTGRISLRTDYDIVGGFNKQRFVSIDAERSVNCFEYIDPRAKKPKSLIFTSGIRNSSLVFPGATGGIRGEFVLDSNNHFCVFGNNVYLITGGLIVSRINTMPLNTLTGYVGISANNANPKEVIFVDGEDGYIWNTGTSTWTQITDANFPENPIDVTFLDGFFVVANGGTNTFRLNQLNQGLVWTPLQQGQINSDIGNIVACRTLKRRLFLFALNFTEVWENSGIGSNLPLRRNNSLLMDYGTPAVGSIAVGFDRMFFLSQDKDGLGAVMMVVGTQSVPVSNKALDYELAQYAQDPMQGVADAAGILLKENGLIFYRLNFTNANHTYVYNVSMSDAQNARWHEEEVLNGDRHPAQTHGYFNGINYVGDYNNPILYILDNSILTNNGESIRRMRIPRPIVPESYERIRVNRFQIDLVQGLEEDTARQDEVPILTENALELLTESGTTLITESSNISISPGNRPRVFLSLSKDGGQSFGNEIEAPMGKLGERTFRTVWRKLGTTKRGQAFQPRIEFYDVTPFVVMGASWDYEILPE